MDAPQSFAAIAALIVFAAVIAAVIFLVLKPQHLRIRRNGRQIAVPISYCWMPLVGVVLLLCCQSLDWKGVGQGIIGDEHIEPYGILILFMALAYIAASLDCTGVFAWLALWITKASKGRGHLLFFLMYGLSAVMTALTSNDVSIMTLTPIIIYFSRATKCAPMPFLVAEFVAANIWSMLLFVGNPTNIIVAQAFGLSFIGYTQWTALPTIVAGITAVLQLYWTMRHELPVQLKLPDINPSTMLTDKVGAWVGSIILSVCIILLALAHTLGWDMWLITLICALVHVTYNAVAMVSLDPVTGKWVGLATLLARKAQQVEGAPNIVHCATQNTTVVPEPEKLCSINSAHPDEKLAGQVSGQHEEGHGKVAVVGLQLRLSLDGGISGSSVHDHERHGSGHLGGDTDASRASRHQSGWVQNAQIELAWGSNPNAASTTVPEQQQTEIGPQLEAVGMERKELPPALDVHCCDSGVALSDSARPGHGQGDVEAGRVSATSDGKGSVVNGSQETKEEEMEVELEPPTRSFLRILTSLPWEVVPFVLGMFIMVEGLKVQGWVEQLSKVLGTASGLGKTGGTLFLMGSFSVALANVINNQPMTILLAQVCLQPIFLSSASPTGDETDAVALSTQRTALFAVVVGSNVGALFSLIGSLAGIMWANVLREMSVKITQWQFIRIMLPIGLTSMAGMLLMLWAEVEWFG